MTEYRILAITRRQGSQGAYTTLYNTRMSTLTRQDAENVALADISEANLEVRELYIVNEATGEA